MRQKKNKESKYTPCLLERKGMVSLLPDGHGRTSLTIFVHPIISPIIKIIESSGKIFWCWEIRRGEITSIQERHFVGSMHGKKDIHDCLNGLLSHELDKKVSSWRKSFKEGELDPYFPNGLDDKSKAFQDMSEIFEDFFDCQVTIEREESILKSIKDSGLFPVLWYNMTNNGSYSVQNYNYSQSVKVAEREVIEVHDFERNIRKHIADTVSNSFANINNWGVVDFSDPRLKNIQRTLSDY